MPRRNVPSRRNAPARQQGTTAPNPMSRRERVESWRGVDYLVRTLAGSSSQASYRCPGCDQVLTASAGHVVVWPADDPDAEDRRHWHHTCWTARDRRQPGAQRSRNAPRYG